MVTAAAATTLGVTVTATVGLPSPAAFGGVSFSVPATPAVAFAETNGTSTCYSKWNAISGRDIAPCGINMLNGTPRQRPGESALATTITLRSLGRQRLVGLRLSAGTCSVTRASGRLGAARGTDFSGFCGQVEITIANTTPGARDKCVFPRRRSPCPGLSTSYTLASLAGMTFNGAPLSSPARRVPATYVVRDQLASTATAADQDLTATLPFSWSVSP